MKYLLNNIPLLWILLFLLLFAFIALLIQEVKRNDVLGYVREGYKRRAGRKFQEENHFFARYGKLENHSYVYKLDRLLLCSGVRDSLPGLTVGRFISLLIISFVTGIMLGQFLFHNILASLFSGAFFITMLYAALLALYGMRYNRIEDDTAVFVSILMNYAKGSSDIITIMEYTSYVLEGPIKHLTESFLSISFQYGNPDIAFDFMKEAVDNRQLQMILMNLKNCMHYEANYEEVLSQMMGQITSGLTAREERKNILFSMKFTLAIISVAALVIVALIGSGLGIDVIGTLTANRLGQLLMFITGILYLFVFLRLFGTDR